MKLVSIYLKEKKQPSLIGKIQYTEERIRLYEELPMEGRYYIMNEYTREKGKILRIGVAIQGAAQVIAQDSWGEKIHLCMSTSEKDLWYQKRQSWMENGYEQSNDALFGANACGEWEVIAYSKEGKKLASEKVKVIPRLLSVEQYYMMQMEVKKHFEDLAVFKLAEKDDRDIIRELQIRLFPIKRFEELFNEWIKWLQEIKYSPEETLITTREKQTKKQIKNWDAKTILESAMFPYREKFSVKTTLKVVDLPEHHMIKSMLEQFRERILQESITEKAILNDLKSILKELTEKELDQDRDDRIAKTIQRRKRQIEDDLNLLQKRQQIWQNSNEKLNEYLNDILFDVEEQEPIWTHLFSSHHVYRPVFELYEKIMELVPELTPRERDFERTILNSPNLFEIWVLFKLIHQFQKLKFQTKGLSDSLLNYYDEHKSLSGWKHNFSSKKDEKVLLYYEPEMTIDDGGSVKPDYMIVTRKNKNSIWHAHSLDAKYKPYTILSPNILTKDLERSGRRYLRIDNRNIEMKTATLVHIDKHTTNWNIDTNNVYSLSQFSAMPGHVENIKTYLKRIFHFYLGEHKMCPSCGQRADEIDDNYKQTYLCDSCNEVWVNNVCKYRRQYHPQQLNVKLLKYPSGNYNVQVGNQWNVYCPICSRDVNGHRMERDPFGNEIG